MLHRIARRMQALGLRDLGAYLHCLRTQPGECAALLHGLLMLGGTEAVDAGHPLFLLLDPSSGFYRQQAAPSAAT